MNSERRVAVTGIGAVTSIGSSVPEFWNNLLEGRCGIGPVTLFDASTYRTQTAAEVREIPDGSLTAAEKRRMSRADRMGLAAAAEAIAQSGLDLSREDRTRIGVILGGGTSGLLDSEEFFSRHLHGRPARPSRVLNHMPDAITDRVAWRFALEGIKSTVTTACSSSANAMGYAHDAIAAGWADVVITGGSDVLARLTYGGFNSLRSVDPDPCRPFDRNRKGLSIGEGAGILVFEEADRARRRGAPILAEFRGYGVTSGSYHMTAPAPSWHSHGSKPDQPLDPRHHGTRGRLQPRPRCRVLLPAPAGGRLRDPASRGRRVPGSAGGRRGSGRRLDPATGNSRRQGSSNGPRLAVRRRREPRSGPPGGLPDRPTAGSDRSRPRKR